MIHIDSNNRQRVTLLRPFWGHTPGTKGTVRKSRLKLHGSPLAFVSPKDIGTLFAFLQPSQTAQ
jgi:hypothetical protein